MKKIGILGAVMALAGVGVAYAAGQFPDYPIATSSPATGNQATLPLTGLEAIPADTRMIAPYASFTGSIAGTALTAGSITGNIAVGQNVLGANVQPGTQIVSGSGANWVVTPSQTVASTAMTSGGSGVNPQTELIQTQQLKAYVLTAPTITSYLTLPITTIAGATTACTASTVNSIMLVSDGTAYGVGGYGGAVGASGAVKRVVLCTAAATLVYN